MNGNTMNKFVYVSHEFRTLYQSMYFKNTQKVWDTSWADEDFKEQLEFKLQEEQHMLRKYTRPHTAYLNDIEGETELVFNMSMKHFGEPQKYEWTADLTEKFTDLLMEKAISIRDKGRKIQVLYSGGIDSSAALLALYEVCPKDQIEVVMGRTGEGGAGFRAKDQTDPVKQNPWMFDNIVKHLDHTFTDDLNGYCDPSKYVFITGNEADRLFGSTGYTLMTQYSKPDGADYQEHWGKAPTDELDENWQWNQNRWWGITRYTYLMQSFRMMANISCDKIDMDNYQPMFFDRKMLQFAINLHIQKKHKWYNCGALADEKKFRDGKMWIRDAIFDITKNSWVSYNMHKTISSATDLNKRQSVPLPLRLKVLAITEDGTVVNRKNLMEYVCRESFTI